MIMCPRFLDASSTDGILRRHVVEIPPGWIEGAARLGLHGIAADFGLVVDDLAAAFRNVGQQADIVRIAIPRPRADGGENMGLHLDGGQGLRGLAGQSSGAPWRMIFAGPASYVPSSGSGSPHLSDHDVVAAVIVEIADAADHQEGQAVAWCRSRRAGHCRPPSSVR